jgi:hypothetical protein
MLITRHSVTPRRQRRHRPRPLHSSKPLPLPFGSTASSSHMSADAFPLAVRQLYSGSGPGRHPLNLPVTSPPMCRMARAETMHAVRYMLLSSST